MTTKVIYETGATSHAVNDLILWTDNTRELHELKESIFEMILKGVRNDTKIWNLLGSAKISYCTQFPDIETHFRIRNLSEEQKEEYVNYYKKDYLDWKQENNL